MEHHITRYINNQMTFCRLLVTHHDNLKHYNINSLYFDVGRLDATNASNDKIDWCEECLVRARSYVQKHINGMKKIKKTLESVNNDK